MLLSHYLCDYIFTYFWSLLYSLKLVRMLLTQSLYLNVDLEYEKIRSKSQQYVVG